MVQLTTRERVDAFWSQTLGVDVAALHQPGIHVRPNPPERDGWRGIYVLAFDKAVTVCAPRELVQPLRPYVDQLDPDTALDPAVWIAMFRDPRTVAHGPSVHHYRDSRTGLADVARGRRINPRDAQALAALRGAVDPDEWSAAGFTAQSALLFGLFDEPDPSGREQLIAAANLTPGPDAATDVSVVVHPDRRGLGCDVAIAATAALQALAIHGIARLRAPFTRPDLLTLAATLGFSEYGRNLVVYLPY